MDACHVFFFGFRHTTGFACFDAAIAAAPLIRSCPSSPLTKSIAPPPFARGHQWLRELECHRGDDPHENGSTSMDTTPDEVGFIYPPPHIKGTIPRTNIRQKYSTPVACF